MQPLFVLIICIIAISIGIIVMVRTRLKSKSKELAEKLNHISSYSEKSNYEQARERLSALNEGVFIDIPSDLNNGFYGTLPNFRGKAKRMSNKTEMITVI